MSDRTPRRELRQQLRRLRDEFDSSFAAPVRSVDDRSEQLLCFTAGESRFAIAMPALQSVVRCSGLTPIPARAPALLGLAVVRAQIVPVYSLPHLARIGTQPGDAHWLVLLRGPVLVAVAVDALHGYVLETAAQATDGGDTSPLIGGLIKHNGNIYATVRAAELYSAIVAGAPERNA